MKLLLHLSETCLGERGDHRVLVLASPVALPPVVLDDTGDAPEMRMLHVRVHRVLGCVARKLDDSEQAQGFRVVQCLYPPQGGHGVRRIYGLNCDNVRLKTTK